MGHTKKVKTTGRFSTRYGKTVREKVIKIEAKQRALYHCPRCSKLKVKRLAAGIWLCKKCGAKFAGKAYSPLE